MVKHAALMAGCAAFAAMAASPALAQSACSRDSLQAAVDSYLAAQAAGDPALMQLALEDGAYLENRIAVPLAAGVVNTPLAIDFSQSLMDETACETFTEIAVSDPAHPYMLGVRLAVQEGRITRIDSLVTDAEDWLFDVANYLMWAPGEDWGEIPADRRDSRQTLIAAATAYYDRFSDPAVTVPFGAECYRLEGGVRTGEGPDAPANSCGLGMPGEAGVLQLVERSFVADPVTGAVVGFSLFGAEGGEPDSHMFRVEDGRIRYVHAITACSDNGCDFGTGNVLGAGPPPADAQDTEPAPIDEGALPADIETMLAAAEARADTGRRWAFTRTRTLNGRTTVERYDPRRPAGDEWFRPEPEDTDEGRIVVQGYTDPDRCGPTAMDRSLMVDGDDLAMFRALFADGLRLVEETGTHRIYAFTPPNREYPGGVNCQSADLGPLLRQLEGEITVKIGEPEFVLRLYADRQIRYRGPRLGRFDWTMRYGEVTPGGPISVLAEDQDTRVIEPIVRNASSTSSYSDFEWVGGDMLTPQG